MSRQLRTPTNPATLLVMGLEVQAEVERVISQAQKIMGAPFVSLVTPEEEQERRDQYYRENGKEKPMSFEREYETEGDE